MLGVNTNKIAGKKDGGVRQKGGSPRGKSKKGLTVVYISSPMKVTTSAAEFRATVQDLTGCDSNIDRFMDCGDHRYLPNREEVEVRRQGEDKARGSYQSIGSCDAGYYPNYLESWESESPTMESGSTFDDMGVQHRDADVYTSRLFEDSTLLEVLGSFDSA